MNLIRQIQKNEKKQNYLNSLLFEKDEESNQSNYSKYNNEKIKNRKIFSDKISKKSNSILSNAYDKINLIKIKSEQINKINTKSLQKISQKYYRMNTAKAYLSFKNLNNNMITMNSTQSTNYYNSSKNLPKKFGDKIINQKRTIKSNFLKHNNLKNEKNIRIIESYRNIKKRLENYDDNANKRIASAIINNKNGIGEDKLKKYSSIDIEELYKSKDQKFINVERFNDAFRIEMNNTFIKFNPKKHLKKLNEMQKDNISLRESMENIKKTINNKVNHFCSKKDLIKQINKIKESNKKHKTIILNRNFPNLTKKYNKFNVKSQSNMASCGYKARALYGKQIHSLEIERNKKKNYKEKHLNSKNPIALFNLKKDLIEKALRKLYSSLDTKNIIKYINDTQKEKAEKNEEIVEYKKDKYFPAFKDVKEYLKEYEIIKMKNNDKDKEIIEKKMIEIENKLLKNYNENKRKLIENIEFFYK